MSQDNSSHSCAIDPASGISRKVIWAVLIANVVMFLLEFTQGVSANSSSLLADAVDFFSDSVSYGVTLFVLGMGLTAQIRAARFKALLMVMLGMFALLKGVSNVAYGVVPHADTMGGIAVLALVVNLGCAALLYRSRKADVNMRSIWLCSRNDAINNILIIIAAVSVSITHTLWPDFIAAVFIACIEFTAAYAVFKQASHEAKR